VVLGQKDKRIWKTGKLSAQGGRGRGPEGSRQKNTQQFKAQKAEATSNTENGKRGTSPGNGNHELMRKIRGATKKCRDVIVITEFINESETRAFKGTDGLEEASPGEVVPPKVGKRGGDGEKRSNMI